jgi:queuine tRNA-ribosyltransferase
MWEDLRHRSARALVELEFPGYAVGGLSVGEGRETMTRVLDWTVPLLPQDRPRYLMGVGLPEDLLAGVAAGVDMFDCVVPTRHARGALLYTFQGKLRLTKRRYRRDFYPVDTACPCLCCRQFTRAYLHHLYAADEVLGTTLGAIHNLTFLAQLMGHIRDAIDAGDLAGYTRGFMEAYEGSAG